MEEEETTRPERHYSHSLTSAAEFLRDPNTNTNKQLALQYNVEA